MKVLPMSYKSYVWPLNPDMIRLECARNLKEIRLPFSGSIVQDLGPGKRVVSGSGRFMGNGCLEEFTRLEGIFTAGGSGALRLPGGQSFSALFSSLKMTGKAGPDSVAYEFVFLENEENEESDIVRPGTYTCAGGENLWTLANRFGTTVDRIRELNPMIQWPNALKAGLRVVLP